MFQHDDPLLYSSDAAVGQSLDELKRLGVNQIRATVLWKNLAPGVASTTAPAGFNGRDPGAYAASGWAPSDRLVAQPVTRRIPRHPPNTAPVPRGGAGPSWPAATVSHPWAPAACASRAP